MTTVQVLLDNRTYPIRIRPGSLGELGEAIRKELEAERVAVITTPRVRGLHHGAVSTGLARMHLRVECFEVPDGERAKTLRWASRLYDGLLEAGVLYLIYLVPQELDPLLGALLTFLNFLAPTAHIA